MDEFEFDEDESSFEGAEESPQEEILDSPAITSDTDSGSNPTFGNGFGAGFRNGFNSGRRNQNNNSLGSFGRRPFNRPVSRPNSASQTENEEGNDTEQPKVDNKEKTKQTTQRTNGLNKFASGLNKARDIKQALDDPKGAAKEVAKEYAKKTFFTMIKPFIPYILIGVGILAAVLLIVLLVVVIAGDLDFEDNNNTNTIVNSSEQINISSAGYYWWPIGGSEVEIRDGVKYATGTPTSTNITSSFSNCRKLEWETVCDPHNGIDIGHNNKNVNYIIAAKEGTIYKKVNGCPVGNTNTNTAAAQCGGHLGNYVVIKHADGNYTIYGHMLNNSIPVNEGDKVNQGQVIGEMGSSGTSSGRHLHFQIDVGGYSNSNAVDPETYVKKDDSRPTFSKLLKMIQTFEGSGPEEGDYYIAYQGEADRPGIITIGYGVVINYHYAKFEKYGYSDARNQITEGTKVLKSIVDNIKLEIVLDVEDTIVKKLDNRGISLYDYQIDALTSRAYNIGNVDGFYAAYEKYGITQGLYDNYMSTGTTSNGQFQLGLKRRREREWKLFTEGLYYGVDYK